VEGNPSCEDPMACEHAREHLEHIENLKRWRATQIHS